MHDLKYIRKETDLFIKKIKERNVDVNLSNVLELDKKNRELIQKKRET